MSELTTVSEYKSELPVGWVRASLEELFQPTRPRVRPADFARLNYVGLEHVEPHTYFIKGTTPASELRSTAFHFLPGDILYARLRPYLSKVVAPDFEGLGSSEFIVLPVHEDLNPKFFMYRLYAADFVAFANSQLTGDRPRVSYDQLKSFTVDLPPSGEQTRIVEEIETQLTRLDAALVSLKRAKANLKRYRASVLKAACEGKLVRTEAELAREEGREYETADRLLERILEERRARWEEAEIAKMRAKGKEPTNDSWKRRYKEPASPDTSDLPPLPEGWTWATVDQLSVFIQYGTSAKTDAEAGEVPVLRMGNIQAGKIDTTALKYLPLDHKEFPDLLLKPGDVLFNRTNSAELVGKSAPYDGVPELCSFASYLIRVRPASGFASELLSVFINSPYGRRWIASVVSQQVGQANVNGTKLRSFAVPVPPQSEQARILADIQEKTSNTDNALELIDANLRRADRLRQSILKRAFEGKLVPQDPNDEPASVLLERIKTQQAGQPKAGRSRQGRRKTDSVTQASLPGSTA